ncbi:prepilin-type N-terminal cleavage/methylation domain-containing protein [Idiomarina sp. UBA4520]|mgnify:CR=1 FL=1|jgi:MSHA pilin protein MshA|uniref:prepilin-type N-terminal cleavage/methylation domain-containing protein n=1 Tax=Idiomarina sp. UBA4520 TaxID=1946647 RepID=UPI000AAD9C7A|nr:MULTISPECIES: prepilin-type N-terminal cleavage/methylation domain-containing protein [unclassified Idiomarina]MBF39686.1 Type II secretory pathway, pseudopilin [Idiomarinaceae bacterium]|tara:strand:+ start:18640 stop:19158 length:519 start_codon:yes stop_codon:yes gene_type:complete
MRNQKGFTLIELIIVIVVLGILAVTAAPQFINFSSDARASTVKGLKGALQGASQTIYARAAIDNELGSTGSVNGVDTVYGYPAASGNGIVEAAQLEAYDMTGSATDGADWAYIVGSTNSVPRVFIAPADFVAGLDSTLTNGGDLVAEGCYVSYLEAAEEDGKPEYESATSGC